ncbi:unnamed protein product [Echinostoma caproni]|uniref:BRO1 domain-containing protein n=1 Tax=Echinostoma caproni TaxID=27848 RepID=A0A183BDK7_9TREM|nr:unnamed protein product [Echinostoma caproni]
MPADSESTKVSNSFYWEESTVTVDGASEDLLLFRKHCEALREAIQNTWIQKQAGEKSVESVSQEIAQKRKYLASFAPKLKELVDNTLVIQKLMDLPFSKEEDQHHMAFLLPTPLYILYAHLKSYLCTMSKLIILIATLDYHKADAKFRLVYPQATVYYIVLYHSLHNTGCDEALQLVSKVRLRELSSAPLITAFVVDNFAFIRLNNTYDLLGSCVVLVFWSRDVGCWFLSI